MTPEFFGRLADEWEAIAAFAEDLGTMLRAATVPVTVDTQAEAYLLRLRSETDQVLSIIADLDQAAPPVHAE